MQVLLSVNMGGGKVIYLKDYDTIKYGDNVI